MQQKRQQQQPNSQPQTDANETNQNSQQVADKENSLEGSKGGTMLRTDLTIDYMLNLVNTIPDEQFINEANSMAFKVRNDHP